MNRPVLSVEMVLRGIVLVGTLLALVAMVVLGVRASDQFDPAWDSLAYHLPFAALRAGIELPFEMSTHLDALYDGAPPLPELVQGLIWRITGSISSTGLANFLAFATFAVWSSVVLRARFWLVVLISLTAPMVVIHTSVSYIDLFTNAFLAIGAASAVYLWLFPERATKTILAGGLLALAAACWSKYTMTPFAGALFLLYVPIAFGGRNAMGWSRRAIIVVVGMIGIVAALPYLRNLMEFGNPFWPFRTPVVGSLFPYVYDNDSPSRPPGLATASSIEAFIRSLLEIDLPTRYELRPRWSIDSGGNVGEAFRMGGFWYVGVVLYLGTMLALLWSVGRRGRVVAAAALVTLGLIALIPQANELRYWVFLPLMWAAIIAMLYDRIVARSRILAAIFGVLVIGLFGYMVLENRGYYSPRPYGWMDAANATGASSWWPQLEPDQVYCAIGMSPVTLLLTGPTQSEYHVLDRSSADQCPTGSVLLTSEGLARE